jgi:metal-responsive CopG/Arc/MetJ family transcriptional regulator
MRTTHTLTISLPPAMVEEFEKVRQAESRTRSELVREALRHYFDSRYPVVEPTKAELAAIRRGRAAFARGDYVSLAELSHDLATTSHRTGRKGSQKASGKRPSAR